jgi:hypothetical protein
MKRVEVDKSPRIAKSGAGTLRAAMLACGFGSLAALTQAQAAGELEVSLGLAGNSADGYFRIGVGERVRLVANATGATGVARYDWDLDGDAVIDRSGTQPWIEAIYPAAFAPDIVVDGNDYYDWYYYENVFVHVTDSTGAQGSGSMVLFADGAQLGADGSGPFTQVCGDGDALKEPGEQWRIPMVGYNFGFEPVRGGYALLSTRDRRDAAVAGESIVGMVAIDRPALAYGDVAAGVGRVATLAGTRDVTIQIARDAPCGASVEILLDQSVDTVGSIGYSDSPGDRFLLAPAGQCQVYTGCSDLDAAVEPRQGLYFNSLRPGNGISVLLQETTQGTMFFGAWFTGDAHRRPTWYVVQGHLSGNQVIAPIYRFTRRPGDAFVVDRSQVGTANVVLIDPEHLAFAYTLKAANGTDHPRVAELMTHIAPGAPAGTDATGAYYSASEAGWGQVLSEYRAADGADTTFLVQYLYDAQGEPRWVLAVEPTSALASAHPYITFPVHCPGCAWLPDWQALRAEVGSGSFTFDAPGHARVSTQFTLPADYGGSWQRNALGVELLTDPP